MGVVNVGKTTRTRKRQKEDAEEIKEDSSKRPRTKRGQGKVSK